ncbi:sensor histidine kinase [Streptomyces sp. TP-A0874]|uniref:sensor histidine kinase n=1 Tax=Streptomyces sp. TP-A0874 TaxID=549819 RepID=UPI0009A0860B|nr:GAF domain-containing protein [Streptomyces sp. TP-A0874]
MAATEGPPEPSRPVLSGPDAVAGAQQENAAEQLRELPEELAARLPELLEAMVSVSSGMGLRTILNRIVTTAARLTGARYAAIGVINDERDGLSDLVTYGMTAEQRRDIARLPDGRTGLLGALIDDPVPVRLADLTEDPRHAGFPVNHPRMRSFLGVPIRLGDGEVIGNLYCCEKEGGAEFTDHDLHLVKVLATQAGIQIASARLQAASRQRERWIDGAAALTTTLLAGGEERTTTDDPLAVVAEQGRRLADAASGIVLLPEEGGGLEIAQVSSELPEALTALGAVMESSSPVHRQLLAGRPVFVDDCATDPRMPGWLSESYGPCLLLPLRSGGEVQGVLVLPRLPGALRYTITERTLATQFSAQAALALVLADAQQDRERLVLYEERDRIARDLHDLVIQRLFATGMMLEGTQRKTGEPEVREGIARAVDELDVTIQEIRTAIFALQQGPTEVPTGLRTRIEREIHMAAVPLHFKPSVRFLGAVDSRVGEAVGKNLVAALREALSNVFRHARASRLEVVVDANAKLPDGRDGVRLTVADDGVGVPAGGRRSGLANLEKRAAALGGSSTLGPGIGADGGGTTVRWEAPL